MIHTPGPWKALFRRKVTGELINAWVNSESSYSIADIWLGTEATKKPDDESIANARLIAAAPQLYEALKNCEAVAYSFGDEELKKEVKQALAAANGE